MPRLLLFFERFDWVLLIAALALTSIGLIIIYGIGVSHDPNNLFPFYKQILALILGISTVVFFTFVDFRQLRSLSLVVYILGIILLLAVLIFGKTVNGHEGWFRLGNLSFQPVELAKITLTLYLATYMSRLGHGRLSWRVFGQSALATGIYVFLIMLQPDLGSAIVIIGIWAAMCLFAGIPKGAWLIIPLLCLLIGVPVWSFGLKPYQKHRITNLINPNSDPQGSGYNAAQARIAVGSGGWFGKGIGEGSQARLRFLPEASTDFIFAVLGEELGFVGIIVTIGLFCLIFYRFVRIAYEAGDDFASLLLIGLGAMFLVHVFVNAGMNLGIMPVTGIPFPFVSSAASSLVMAYISIGLVESIAVRRRYILANQG